MKKISAIILAILFSGFLQAQENSGIKLSVNHIALSVKDADRSAEFYKTVLLLPEITNRTKLEGIRWVALADGRELHLISVIKEPVIINKAVHLGLTSNDFDAILKRLTDLKIPYSDWPGKPSTFTNRADGVKQLYFQDPDGYWIEVNSVNDAASVEQTKNEVWQMKENYWKYVKANDLTSYLSLWDKKFIGYPTNNIITGKDHITDWIVNMYKENAGKYNYELDKKAVNAFGDIVIAIYDVTHTWTNEKNESLKKPIGKIIHTWKKTDKGWVIIGGMGANK